MIMAADSLILLNKKEGGDMLFEKKNKNPFVCLSLIFAGIALSFSLSGCSGGGESYHLLP